MKPLLWLAPAALALAAPADRPPRNLPPCAFKPAPPPPPTLEPDWHRDRRETRDRT